MTEPCPIGIVVIGRNEGERLKRCLSSIQCQISGPVVYVDSGSTDGSADYARSVGVDVVDLDISVPFTMARGRNTGLDYLVDRHGHCQFVQFVDGDCEMVAGWLKAGLQFLQDHQDYAGVCGNRSERFPDATIYNQLIEMEWQGRAGEVDACGGDAIYRIDMLQAAGCFNEAMIAGEEADLCLRLRQLGSRLMRLDSPMTVHDANMQYFSQWWKRSVRCGHAYAHGYDMHKNDPEVGGKIKGKGYKQKPVLSSLIYGLGLPALLILALLMSAADSLDLTPLFAVISVVVILYIRALRNAAMSKSKFKSTGLTRQSWLYAGFILLGKSPEAEGVLRYYFNKVLGKTSKLIEYKTESRIESKIENKDTQGSDCSPKD